MELQFKKNSISCLHWVKRELGTQEVTQEVRLTEAMPDIGRVLCSWGQMIIRSKEWRGDTVTVVGGIMAWILYAPEDGTEPRCIDAWIPYQLRWEHMDADREGPLRISPLLRFVDARTVSARKFMVRAGAAAYAEAMCPGQVQCYSGEEVPEDVELLRRIYPVRLPKEAGEKIFQMDEELPLNDAQNLLSYSLQPEITDCRVLANKVVFRGTGRLHLIYCCPEGRIRTSDFEVPFSQFAELESSYSPDARADICFGITLLELDLEDGKLGLKCGLVAQYLVDDRELVEIAEDAYSPRRMVNVQLESLRLPSILEDRMETLTASHTAQNQRGEVVDLKFMPDFPRQRRSADGVELEIPGVFQTLYYGEDGILQSSNTRWETRLELPAGENSRIDPMVFPQGEAVAMQKPDGMELSAHMALKLRTTSDSGLPMVTGLELGELQEPDDRRPSLIVCRPGGESMWEIAKRTGSTIAAIQNANGIQDEMPTDRMILIPIP